MKTLSCSTVGQLHRERGLANQDCVMAVEGDGRAVYALADGVSGCAAGGTGARLVCERLCDRLLDPSLPLFDESPERLGREILGCALAALEEASKTSGIAVDEYASTLCLALVDRASERVLLFQLGDSLIFVEKEGEVCVRLGEVNEGSLTVCTTTQDAHLAASVRLLSPREYDSITMLSDGAWRPFYRDRAAFSRAISALEARDGETLVRHIEAASDEPDDASLLAIYRI